MHSYSESEVPSSQGGGMTFKGQLYPFQEEAVQMMLSRGSLLLAHGLGLGKTVTSIAACEELIDDGSVECVLVVCPASLKWQWARQLHNFTDGALVKVIEGTKGDRRAQYRGVKRGDYEYVICNYEQVVQDWDIIRHLTFDAVVCDEVVAIKNPGAKRSRHVKRLDAPYKFGLSGQPIENKPEELFCVDASTEVLSNHGWLQHDQLSVGDVVLTLNHATGVSEWQPVQAVNQFAVQDQDMISMEHTSHSSLTTPNHRWPVERVQQSGGHITGRRRDWATSDSFRWGDRVPIAAECADLPTEQRYTDALVELVAWFYTEGHIRKLRNGMPGKAVTITQNTSDASRIRGVLGSVLGPESGPFPRTGQQVDGIPRWREDCDGLVSIFKLNTSAGAQLLMHAPNRVPSCDFLLSMTRAQLSLFIEVSMLADNNGQHWFSQKDHGCAEAFQLACVLAGHATSIRPNPKVDYDRNGNPYHMTTVCLRRQHYLSPGQSPRLGKTVRYTGTVWCPTTPNGTWLARRNGSVYFTGNSIMQWIDPEVLGPHAMFDKTFIVRNNWGAVKHYRNLRTLRERMTKAMHRVTRHEVADQMPSVVEKSYIIDMDPATQRLYRRIVVELLKVIASAPKLGSFNLASHYAGVDDGGAMGEIMPRLMALRMLCDHPALLTYSADNFDDPDTKAGSAYASSLQSLGLLDGLNFKSSPKLKQTLEVVDDFLDADPLNKVVLFSFFKPMLRLLQADCKWDSEMYTGDLTPHERDDAVQRFQNDPKCRVFFSSDAGGIGVDIPAGNLLISYDLPWSAGKWEQRNGRIIRISSEWPEVTLISMLMRDSIEERMYDMLEEKSAVASAWLDGEGIDAQGTFTLSLGTLADFLYEH
jgi:hypothetical protein